MDREEQAAGGLVVWYVAVLLGDTVIREVGPSFGSLWGHSAATDFIKMLYSGKIKSRVHVSGLRPRVVVTSKAPA